MDPKHEQSTNETTPRRARNMKKNESNPQQAEMKIQKSEDDVLNVIEHVESQLGALRKAHEEHRQAMADISKRKRELETQAEELNARESELTSREVELAEMRQDFEAREMNLVQRAGGLEQRESKLVTQAELLEQQEADLAAKDKKLEAKIQELDSQLAGLSKRKAELDLLEEKAKAKLAREDDSAAKLKVVAEELVEARASLREMSGQVESFKKELDTTVSKLRGREIELDERSHTLEELAERSGAIQHELETTRQQYGEQIAEMAQKLTSEQKIAQKLRDQIDQLKSENEKAGSASVSQIADLTDKLAKATAEIESLRQSAANLTQQSDEHVQTLQAQLKESQSQVQALTEQVNEIGKCADDELTAQRESANELEGKIQLLTKELEEAHAQSALLKERIESKPNIDPQELNALKEKLKQANDASIQSARKLEEMRDVVDKLQDDIKVRDEQHAKSQERVQELENQSSKLLETIEELNTKLEESKSESTIHADQWNQNRRDRLAKMRKILAGDAEKIRLATEALRTRYDQCEQVLSKRAELAQAYEEIAAAQRKYQNREVRSGVFLGLIGMAAITLVLAATSWFVSGRIAPGVYAAKVTMAAAGGDTKLTEAQMQQWETYITALTSDPRFLEVAADRMKRRGITEFGVPGDLAAEMQNALDVASAMPGTIVMEYRGVGAQRAERVLDTFAVALSSAANNARARRADSSLTIIEDPAKAGADPLDTRRIEMAGMIFGGSMVLTLIFGGVLWKRLSAAKAQFERESSVEALFDESQWQMPG